jgi:hypothetical protein
MDVGEKNEVEPFDLNLLQPFQQGGQGGFGSHIHDEGYVPVKDPRPDEPFQPIDVPAERDSIELGLNFDRLHGLVSFSSSYHIFPDSSNRRKTIWRPSCLEETATPTGNCSSLKRILESLRNDSAVIKGGFFEEKNGREFSILPPFLDDWKNRDR